MNKVDKGSRMILNVHSRPPHAIAHIYTCTCKYMYAQMQTKQT